MIDIPSGLSVKPLLAIPTKVTPVAIVPLQWQEDADGPVTSQRPVGEIISIDSRRL